MTALEGIRRQIARHAGVREGRGGMIETPLPGVRFATALAPSEPICDLIEPTFALVVQGEKWTVLGKTAFPYGPGRYVTAATPLPITGAITQATPDAPFLAFVMQLEPAAIAALLLDAGAGPTPPEPAAALAVNDAGPSLLDAVGRTLGLLDAPPRDVAALAPLYEREILWRLINGEQGANVRRIGLADSSLAHIGRAIGWIRTHYREPLRIEQLAELATMSVSSFYRHFRAVTQMTPIQYQRQLRLTEARALLATRPGDVAGVGFAVGYDSASQFSREYRRMFGVPPGRDGARLRELAEAGVPGPRVEQLL